MVISFYYSVKVPQHTRRGWSVVVVIQSKVSRGTLELLKLGGVNFHRLLLGKHKTAAAATDSEGQRSHKCLSLGRDEDDAGWSSAVGSSSAAAFEGRGLYGCTDVFRI